MKGSNNKESYLKDRSKVPKPGNFKAPYHSKKNKLKYLNTQNSLKPTLSSRNEKYAEFSSMSNKLELHKMRSTEGDESETCNLDLGNLDNSDKMSQYSIQVPRGNAKENLFNERAHSNSFSNAKSEIGLLNKPNDTIDYSGRELLQVPLDIINNLRLQRLKLSHNKLTVLPNKICDLIFLKSLLVDNNLLRSLPSNIGKLTRLKVLDFHNNKIEDIPRELGDCISLKKVYAKNNNFTALPSSLGKLEHLMIFDIEWFKYCLPPIRISSIKDGTSNRDSLLPIMRKFKEL